MSIPTYHFGLRIRASFGAALPSQNPIVPETYGYRWPDGSPVAFPAESNHGNPVQALAEWICPRGDGPGVRLAQSVAWNPEAGTIDAYCYGEHAARVLTVLRRLGARTLDAHSVSI